MQSGTFFHFPSSEDGGDLDECFCVVVGVEEGESTSEEAEKDNSSGPNIDSYESSVSTTRRPRRGRTNRLIDQDI